MHSALKIPEAEITQEDIQDIVGTPDMRVPTGNLYPEVIATFFCPRKRDSILSDAAQLATLTDDSGRPTLPPGLLRGDEPMMNYGTKLMRRSNNMWTNC